ncbi:hypothetical protein CF335_g6913 [Tilletia laevis]|nr:hypothetical protein CF335_g6913 [Tilletia laevis]
MWMLQSSAPGLQMHSAAFPSLPLGVSPGPGRAANQGVPMPPFVSPHAAPPVPHVPHDTYPPSGPVYGSGAAYGYFQGSPSTGSAYDPTIPFYGRPQPTHPMMTPTPSLARRHHPEPSATGHSFTNPPFSPLQHNGAPAPMPTANPPTFSPAQSMPYPSPTAERMTALNTRDGWSWSGGQFNEGDDGGSAFGPC